MEEHVHEWQRAEDVYERYECAGCFEHGWKSKDGPIEALPFDVIEQIRNIIALWEVSNVDYDTLIEVYLPRMLTAVEYQKQQLQEARALLTLLASDEAEPVFALSEEQDDGYECLRCDTMVYRYEPDHFPHAPECPWLRARAFLNKES